MKPLLRIATLGHVAVSAKLVQTTTRSSRNMSHSHKLVPNGTSLILEPKQAATATVILSHGLGDTAHGWVDTAAEIGSELPHVRFVLPTAPTRPVTMNGGFPMPAWYDIESLSRSRTLEKCEGIDASKARIGALITKEVDSGIPASRIVLSGFSQGGAMSLYVGCGLPFQLAGILVMSGYLPKPEGVKPTSASMKTPIMMYHGDADAIVPLAFGEDALTRVKEMGFSDVSMKVYRRLGHGANEEEILDVVSWLSTKLPAVSKEALSAAL